MSDIEATNVPKVNKKKANYRLSSSMSRRCHVCENIQLHGAQMATCRRVLGTVERDYVCDLFDARNDNDGDEQ